MKKILLVLGIFVLMLQGCSVGNRKDYTEKVKQYQAYYETILDQDKFQKSSRYFDIRADFQKVKDEYVYEVIVDNPKIAMYDVKILVIEDDTEFNEDEFMPVVGIFENKEFHLIPGQVRNEAGYMSGFQLLGETKNPQVKLKVLVSFNDYRKLETYYEFIEIEFDEKEEKKEDKKEETKEKDQKKSKDKKD